MAGLGGKLEFLDGLRGAAALIVVFHHYALAFFPSLYFGGGVLLHFEAERWIYNSPLNLLVAGPFAVIIFFVISGFVLSYKYFQTRKHEVAVAGAVKRYFRLMPLVLAAVLISFVVMALGLYRNLPAAEVTGSHLWLAQSWVGTGSLWEAIRLGVYDAFFTGPESIIMKYDNVLWTMKIELMGSFLVFAFLALFGNLRRRWVVYIAMGLVFWNSYFLAFIMGMALCDWVVAERKRGRLLGKRFWGGAAIAEGLALGTLNVLGPSAPFKWQILTGAATLLVAGLMLAPGARRVLSIRPVAYLGRVSFSLYVVHLTILASLGCWLFLKLAPETGYLAAVAISSVLSIGITFLVAEIFTRYIDQPAIRLSNVFYRRVMLGEKPVPEPVQGKVKEPVVEKLPIS